MTNHRVIVEANEEGYYVEFPDLNWGFYSVEPRSSLEDDIKREIELVTAEHNPQIVLDFGGSE